MRKRDVLLIVENPVRNNIIMRLSEAEKAAYSDLLDSAGPIEALDSRGNFNYHLSYLLQNSMVAKEGLVYRLTDKGRSVAQFIKDVNQIWEEIEPKLRGEYMSIVGYSEDFEAETGIKMMRKVAERKLKDRIEMVIDEKSVIGIIDEEKCGDEYFRDYEEIKMNELKLTAEENKEVNGERQKHYAFGHPDLTYHLSPFYLGSTLLYMQRNFGEAYLFGDKKKPMPFMMRARKLDERYEGPALLIAPVVFRSPKC